MAPCTLGFHVQADFFLLLILQCPYKLKAFAVLKLCFKLPDICLEWKKMVSRGF